MSANVCDSENNLIVHAELKRKRHNCINCGTATDTIQDYNVFNSITFALFKTSLSEFKGIGISL